MATKRCTKCGETKDLDRGFWKQKASKDGYSSWCKQCKNEWQSENKRKKFFSKVKRPEDRPLTDKYIIQLLQQGKACRSQITLALIQLYRINVLLYRQRKLLRRG